MCSVCVSTCLVVDYILCFTVVCYSVCYSMCYSVCYSVLTSVDCHFACGVLWNRGRGGVYDIHRNLNSLLVDFLCVNGSEDENISYV